MIKAQGKDGKAKKQGPKNADEDAKVYHGEYHDHSFLRDIPEHDALLRRTYGAGFGTIHSPRERSNAESSSPPGIHNDEQTFPFQLHYMLSELERDGLGHIVSWQPHGRYVVPYKAPSGRYSSGVSTKFVLSFILSVASELRRLTDTDYSRRLPILPPFPLFEQGLSCS